MNENQYPYQAPPGNMPPEGPQPGNGAAVASLVLGIIGVVLWFFGVSAVGSVILGIVGLILAGNAKKQGNSSGVRTAGFVLSLISLLVGAVIFVACLACMGTLSAAGALSSMY